jgi:hypothetical protein
MAASVFKRYILDLRRTDTFPRQPRNRETLAETLVPSPAHLFMVTEQQTDQLAMSW